MAVPTFPILFDILSSDDFIAFVPERLLRKRNAEWRIFEIAVALLALNVIANWPPRVGGDPQHKWLRALLLKVAKNCSGHA